MYLPALLAATVLILLIVAVSAGFRPRPLDREKEGYTVLLENLGRCGWVIYREPGHEARFSWEFGGRDVVLIIVVPTPAVWPEQVPWAAHRRTEVLDRVAREVQRQQCRGCRSEISDHSLEMKQR